MEGKYLYEIGDLVKVRDDINSIRKYYMRSGNRATLTFLADNLEKHTRVHLSAGGGGQGVIFRFDWGAGASFSTSARDALAEYICK